MKTVTYEDRVVVAVVVIVAAGFCGRAWGDFSTPFVESIKAAGVEEEGWGYVVTKGAGDGTDTTYWVLVLTDTRKTVLINAKAEKGVVPLEMLGKQAKIKGVVVKTGVVKVVDGMAEGMEVKIVGVTIPKK